MGLQKLRFSNAQTERAYWNFRNSSRIETFRFTLLFWVLLLLSLIYAYLLTGNTQMILVSTGALCVIILLFWLKKEMIDSTRYPTVIATLALLLGSLSYFALKIDEHSKILQFLRSCTFAGAEIFLVHQFQRFRLKCLFVFVLFAVRFGFLAFFENEAFVENVMMQNFVTDIFVVSICYHCEARERVIFKDYFDYREEFAKFKDFLENHLPQSVIILNSQTFSPLFVNKAFAKDFTKKFSSRNLSTSETGSINSLAIDTLDLLFTQNDSIRSSCKWEPDSSQLGNGITLRHFLQELMNGRFFGVDAITITCFYQDLVGKRFLFEVILMPLTWNRENAVAIVLNDITFQEKLMALKQADKNKDIIITTVSHELRTPVNAITGLLQIIEAKTTQLEVRRDVSLCRDNAAILSSLINSIVDLQLFSKGKLKLKLTEVDLYGMLKDTVSLFQFVASQKSLYLNLKIEDDIEKFIITDENRLRQIIINLIGNAIKFTFHGGVEIFVEKDPMDLEHIRFSVRDTGVGIKEDQKKNLFKIYGNLEETNDVSKNGAGLGLTVCDTLANALLSTKDEQKIHVESKDGVGTTFWFKIPKNTPKPSNSIEFETHWTELSNRDEKRGASKRLPSFDSSSSLGEFLEDYDEKIELNRVKFQVKSHTLRGFNTRERASDFHSFPTSYEEISLDKFQQFSFGHTLRSSKSFGTEKHLENGSNSQNKGLVLIVDDNPFNLRVAQNVLVRLGYNVETAASGEEALNKTKSFSEKRRALKFILMDIQMPVMDGYETTRQLKMRMKRNEINETPVIALSANDQDEDIQNALESGMIAHISKPLVKDKLDACLSKL